MNPSPLAKCIPSNSHSFASSLKIALLPWLNQENYEESMNFIRECKADWLGAHLELMGFDMLKGIQNHHGMNPEIFKKFEMEGFSFFCSKNS